MVEPSYFQFVMRNIAYLFNPFCILYTGYWTFQKAFMIPFIAMHTARILWLTCAYLFEQWSEKYKPAKYIAWVMIFLFLLPSLRLLIPVY